MAGIGLRGKFSTAREMVAAFEEPNFRLLWIGRFSSNLGRMLRVVIRGWMVYELTGSPLLMGVVWSSLSWPMLFMPLVGGVLADRFDRRKILLITESSLVILWATVSLLITLGPALAGILKGVGLGWDVLFWMTTLLQLFTTLMVFLIRWQPRFRPQAPSVGFGRSLLDGLAYIRGEPVLLGLFALGIGSALFAGSYTFLLPIFVGEILNLQDYWLAWLMTASAIGSSIGSVAGMALSKYRYKGRLLVIAVIANSLLMVTFSQSQLILLSLAVLFGMGLFQVLSTTIIRTGFQLLAPDHLRGRIMSLQVVQMGLPMFGALLMGAVAESNGVPFTVALMGTLYGIVAMTLFMVLPQLRRFS